MEERVAMKRHKLDDSLLVKAQSVVLKRRHRPITEADEVLALAWVKCEVGMKQCAQAWGTDDNGAIKRIAYALRHYVSRNGDTNFKDV